MENDVNAVTRSRRRDIDQSSMNKNKKQKEPSIVLKKASMDSITVI